MAQKNGMKSNNRYEVLTPSGWSDFDGIKKTVSKSIISIILSSGKNLKCTSDHRILSGDNFVCASTLKIEDFVETTNGPEKIISITENQQVENVYDLLEVKKENIYFTEEIVSHNCEFLGSSGTLIDGATLKSLVPQKPLRSGLGTTVYEEPEKDKTYVAVVDVSRGKGLDYSIIQMIDITKMPYKQVCVFRDNTIPPVEFVEVIHRMCKSYNDAVTLIEINDIGGQVSELLYSDYEYENVLFTESAGRAGIRISSGFGKNVDKGVRTTKHVKSVGCSILKLLVEQKQLLLNDFETIKELSTFSRKASSYEAESGCHDDLVMGLVLFAWMSDQKYFKELTDINTLAKLREKTEEELMEEVPFFGNFDDGRSSDDFFFNDEGQTNTKRWYF